MAETQETTSIDGSTETISVDDSTSEGANSIPSARRTATPRSSLGTDSEEMDASKPNHVSVNKKRRREVHGDYASSDDSEGASEYVPKLLRRSTRRDQRSSPGQVPTTRSAGRPAPMRYSLMQRISTSINVPKNSAGKTGEESSSSREALDDSTQSDLSDSSSDGEGVSKIPKRRGTRRRVPVLKARVNQVTKPPPGIRCPKCWRNLPDELIGSHIESCIGVSSSPDRPNTNGANFTSIADNEEPVEHDDTPHGQESENETISKRKTRTPSRPHVSTGTGTLCSEPGSNDLPTNQGNATKPQPTRTIGGNYTICEHVESVLRTVRQERMESTQTRLRQMLKEKNARLQGKHDIRRSGITYGRLPRGESQPFDESLLRARDFPIPIDTHHTVFLRKNFSSLNVDENSSDEGDSSVEISSPRRPLQSRGKNSAESDPNQEDTLERLRKQISPSQQKHVKAISEFLLPDRIGTGYEEAEVDTDIDNVLARLRQDGLDGDEAHEHLAVILQEGLNRIKRRWAKTRGTTEPRRQHSTVYEDVMSSFRDLFCRRCFMFDCNLHGLPDDFNPAIQSEMAVRFDNSGFFKAGTSPICLPATPRKPGSNVTARSSAQVAELTETQKQLCQRLLHLFQNDLEKVATATGIPSVIISRQMLEPFDFKLTDPALSSNPRTKQNKTNSYHPEWTRRIEEATSHPFFNPCSHEGPCSEKTCSCIQNRFFCTKACLWGATSRNYFRGCNCISKCTAKSCPCFAANRECDPDLCHRCGACADPGNGPARNQNCRNDNIGMRRHVHLLLGKSEIAGWGLFTKYSLAKGDYVHEYLGELIPHNEAERRGKVYDERNQTYIFDMSTDYAVDALRKGNKTRFINHSDHPNIGPKMKVVNGDFRIGFFALKDIPAHTELFFDYGEKFFKAAQGFELAGSNCTYR